MCSVKQKAATCAFYICTDSSWPLAIGPSNQMVTWHAGGQRQQKA